MNILITVAVTFFAGMGAGLGTGFAGMSAAAVISPITVPQTADRTARFRGATLIIATFVVMTGRTMNLIPRRNVMKTEKLPIAADGRRLATKLPRTVNASTLAIMIRPFFMSRFLLFP